VPFDIDALAINGTQFGGALTASRRPVFAKLFALRSSGQIGAHAPRLQSRYLVGIQAPIA